VQSREKTEALPRWTLINGVNLGRVTDRAVGPDERLVVPAGILAVCDVPDVIAIAGDIVSGREARHDPAGVNARDVAGRGRLPLLEPRAEIGHPPVVYPV